MKLYISISALLSKEDWAKTMFDIIKKVDYRVSILDLDPSNGGLYTYKPKALEFLKTFKDKGYKTKEQESKYWIIKSLDNPQRGISIDFRYKPIDGKEYGIVKFIDYID